MRIKDLTPTKLDEYADENNDASGLSDTDIARIMSVKDSDFGPGMTGDEFTVYMHKLLGVK